MILKHLIPVKLSIGILPKNSLLEKYNLLEVCWVLYGGFLLFFFLFLFLHWSFLSISFLSKTLSWWRSSSFHGLFPSRWCLFSPLLLYLSLQLHGWKSPLIDLIEAQRFSLHRSFSSNLPSVHIPLWILHLVLNITF